MTLYMIVYIVDQCVSFVYIIVYIVDQCVSFVYIIVYIVDQCVSFVYIIVYIVDQCVSFVYIIVYIVDQCVLRSTLTTPRSISTFFVQAYVFVCLFSCHALFGDVQLIQLSPFYLLQNSSTMLS